MLEGRPSITVIGLGPGDPKLLTVAAADVLSAAERVWIRTADHPSRAAIPTSCQVSACDDLYRAHQTFEEVYRAIAERLIAEAQEREVVYAVPGDPSVGETSVRILGDMAAKGDVVCRIVPGISFIGPTLAALGWDALDGVQIADATALASRHHPDIDPERPALIAQIYSPLVASDIKLCLLARYPEDHPVTLVSGAGEAGISGASAKGRLITLPLCDLDRDGEFDDVTTLAVPPLPAGSSMLGLAEVIARLRAPDGCPWDQEQTHESLRPYLIEEAYEVVEAIDADDPTALSEELGDLLLQVALHAQIATEYGEFTLTDVIRSIHDKLVRRHPHVFGDAHAETAADVVERWAELKAEEKRESSVNGSVEAVADPMAGVPKTLPALARAQALVRRAPGKRSGEGDSELARAAIKGIEGIVALGEGDREKESDFADAAILIGDTLWALAKLAGTRGIDAETALREACSRFEAAIRSDVSNAGEQT